MRFLVLVASLAFAPAAIAQQSIFTWPQIESSIPGDTVTCHVGVSGWHAITSFEFNLTANSGVAIQAVELPPAAVVTSSALTSTEASVAANLAAPATLYGEFLVLATISYAASAPNSTSIQVLLQTTGPAGATGFFGIHCIWDPPNAFTVSAPALEKWGAQVDTHRVVGSGTQSIRTLLANTGSMTEMVRVTALLTSPDGLQYMQLPQAQPPVLGPGESAEFELPFDHGDALAVAGGWTALVRAWGSQPFGGAVVGSDRSKTLHYRVVP